MPLFINTIPQLGIDNRGALKRRKTSLDLKAFNRWVSRSISTIPILAKEVGVKLA